MLRAIPIVFIILGFIPFLFSCTSNNVSGNGYLIGKIDLDQVGNPVFKNMDPEYGSITYIDRKNGIIFISANAYETVHGVKIIESGPEAYPSSPSLKNSGIQESIKIVKHSEEKNFINANLCDEIFSIKTDDPMKIYKDMKIRSFPIVELLYIEREHGIYDITISYFIDCKFMKEDLQKVIGRRNLLNG